MTAIPSRDEIGYLLHAARWDLVAIGVIPGVVSAVWVHLRAGAMPLAVALGTSGIAVGAAFVLDDAAADTLESVPVTVRRRVTVRAGLAGALSLSAWGYLMAAVWTPLRFDHAALELAGLVVLVVGAGALGGRLGGWKIAGLSGAGVVASVLLLDEVLLARHVVVSGGGGHATATWWLAAVPVAVAAFVAATRDPAMGPRRRRQSSARPVRS